MSLKGLTKTEVQDNKAAEAQTFIQGANARIQGQTPTQKESKATYIRQTFSLTQEVSDQIDELLVECRVARANRSLIVKAAIRELAKLDGEELNRVVREVMG